jgi:PAS domain S-box-containing protein
VQLSSQLGANGIGGLQVMSEDGGLVFGRGWRHAEGGRKSVLVVLPASQQPAPADVDRLSHEYSLKDELNSSWAVRPLNLVREPGRTILVLEDSGGELLGSLLGTAMETGRFLRIAIGATAALGGVHRHGLIHKDIKPANILVNTGSGEVRLTGFGIASRLTRERQAPDPPEVIAGTLAYMAPEQTGRMNRSIDSRSDLYSLGVTLYEMLTGSLPFTASDPMEWVHCHIARQAHAPRERADGIPEAVSSIVMKLLAKTAEERYQTAAGVEADLRRCLGEWQSHSRIDPFQAGGLDASDRLLIPEVLYGREPQIATLLASFDRVVGQGRPELVLVSGYSGIGKSSLVNELHKPLVPPRGFFASGKFDQYKRDIPYATLAQALQTLIRPILTKNEEELGRWRDTIREALGPNGRLMVDLVPELNLIIGEQQPIPELPPRDAQRRFQLVFRRFIGAFTREHPLALFLDDLQWLDAATLDLMEDLLTHPDVKDLMLIGAYRDNEVSRAHPLMRKLQAIRQAGATVHDIVLAPLTRDDLEQLIADSLHCERADGRPLAGLVQDKTSGNPFFVIQFISALFEQGLLIFDHIEGRWRWDLNHIHAKSYTDNVVDLMVAKLNRLPTETQKALQQLACLGNSADFAMLRMVYQDSSEQMHGQIWEAVRVGLIFRSETSYRFLHDRVQEAAYSLIPQELRANAHLQIGMLMASRTSQDKLEEGIFEITNQLNRGSHLITSTAERERIGELNLIAGRRAKTSTAYASALRYLHAGRGLLADETWDRNYELIFSIEYLLASCELLTADMAAAETRLSMLAERAKKAHDIALVTRLRLTLYDLLGRSDRGVEVFIEYEKGHGKDWSPHPTSEEVSREYDQIWSTVGNRQVEELVDLPLITNSDVLDVLDVYTEFAMSAMFTDGNLHDLLLCRMVSLSLEHGNSEASCFAYASLGLLAGPHFGNYEAGFQLGKLGYDLVEKHGWQRYQARVYVRFGNGVIPWTRHVKTGRELVRRAFDVANRMGDLTFAAYSCYQLITNLLATGDPLAEVQREAEAGLEFAGKALFGIVVDILTGQLAIIRTLRGSTTKFGSFEDANFDELQFERRLSRNPALALPECRYWIRKLQARFFAEDYRSAIQASLRAERLLWTSHSYFEVAEYYFFGALARAAAFDSATKGSRQKHLKALTDHYRQLAIWAENCPENFENRAALVGAEIARIEGRDLDAMRLYEQAIRSAREHGFVQNEGVAYEVTARFYSARGSETSANAHLREARDCYLRWGADGKVRQLEARYPQLQRSGTKAATSPNQNLDITAVVKASQALSSEMMLPGLIDRLMTIAVQNAGADRGLLILPQENDYRIEAEARADGEQVVLHYGAAAGRAVPEAIIRYVMRTRESTILDDASKPNMFSDDHYLRKRQSKSILCLPLVKQQQLTGILLLENTLTSHAFTADRMAVLELIAAQAAISLENSRLYGDLLRAGADLQLQVELLQQLPVSAWTLKPDGTPDFVNRVWLEFAGQTLDFVRSHPEAWMTAIHPEDREFAAKSFWKGVQSGQGFAFENRSLRAQDGIYRRHLNQAVVLRDAEGKVLKFVGTTTDIDDQKRAEEALRQAAAELAHANRVTTMGELTASIAHEVNQPVAAALLNAGTAARWLSRQQPNLEEVRLSIERISSDAKRAAAIVSRIREFSRKAPLRKADFEINEAILDIMGLARVPISDNGVTATMQLADGLPHIFGDRVQLQQVILNLIMNAIEAMSEIASGSRELVISSKTQTDGVLVSVSDCGPGLPQANPERVFEAFFTTKASGLGMGLAICRSIVTAHGGRLSAIPNQPRGAVFCMTLPIAEGSLENSKLSEPLSLANGTKPAGSSRRAPGSG